VRHGERGDRSAGAEQSRAAPIKDVVDHEVIEVRLPPNTVWAAPPVGAAELFEVILGHDAIVTRSIELRRAASNELIAHQHHLTSHWTDLNCRCRCRRRVERRVDSDCAVSSTVDTRNSTPLAFAWTGQDDHSIARLPTICCDR
jgi:hypothetical protein